MPSDLAKTVAGTYIADALTSLPSTLAWATCECRHGRLAESIQKFCHAQPENLDASLVLAEQITSDAIQCRIPCKCFDHESASTFATDVRFALDPAGGNIRRLA